MRRLISDQPSRQLVSGGRESRESELLYFLESYVKLDNTDICSQQIDVGDVVVWVFVHGVWEGHTRPKKKGVGSWCQVYLTSILGLTPAQYEKAKKELFRSADGMTGVYRHRTEPKYALVYKPSAWLSSSTIAALAAGAAGVGGLAATRHLINKKRENKRRVDALNKDTAKPSLMPASPQESDALDAYKDARRPYYDNRPDDGDKQPDPDAAEAERDDHREASPDSEEVPDADTITLANFNNQFKTFLNKNKNREVGRYSNDIPLSYDRVVHILQGPRPDQASRMKNSAWHTAQQNLDILNSLATSKQTQDDLIHNITKKRPMDYEAWRKSPFWTSTGGKAYARFIEDDELRDAIEDTWSLDRYTKFMAYMNQGKYDEALDLLEEIYKAVSVQDSLYNCRVLDQLMEQHKETHRAIYLALKQVYLNCMPNKDRSATREILNSDYQDGITEAVQTSKEIVTPFSWRTDTASVKKSIKELRWLAHGYLELDPSAAPAVANEALEQADKLERNMTRQEIFGQSSILEKIAKTELKEDQLPDDLGRWIMYADTFIGDQQEDIDTLKKFRLLAGPIYLKYVKYNTMFKNRILDLIDFLKSSDKSLSDILTNQDIKVPESKNPIEEVVQAVNRLEQILAEYTDYEFQPAEIRDSQIAQRQARNTRMLTLQAGHEQLQNTQTLINGIKLKELLQKLKPDDAIQAMKIFNDGYTNPGDSKLPDDSLVEYARLSNSSDPIVKTFNDNVTCIKQYQDLLSLSENAIRDVNCPEAIDRFLDDIEHNGIKVDESNLELLKGKQSIHEFLKSQEG
jgi:hypothetical protein